MGQDHKPRGLRYSLAEFSPRQIVLLNLGPLAALLIILLTDLTPLYNRRGKRGFFLAHSYGLLRSA